MSNLTLTSPHPYYGTLGQVTLTVDVLDEVPGPIMQNFRSVTGNEWTPLSRELCIDGYAAVTERPILLGMIWDLMGKPIHPKKGRRPAGTFAVVACPKTKSVMIWRPSREMLNSALVRTVALRELGAQLADTQRNIA
jgi:hypothetical protein